MMISDLATSWPPSVAPVTNVGYKHIIEEVSAEYTFSLQRLHEPAWWTGFQVTSIDTPRARIAVTLRKSNGSIAFDTAEDQCKWVQDCNTWTHFPWPIPAKMADAMGLYLDISLIEESESSHLSMKAAFHEMDGLHADERFLFIAGNGVLVHHWDGERNMWGNPIAGLNPAWNVAHTVVPTIAQVLASQEWNDNKLFAIQDWNEIVPPA
jgi:hypothetical protein